jgi:putative copper export protein
VINLQLSFGFGWWPDVANIAMRIVHSVAGLSYFVVTGLVFGLAWFGMDLRRQGLVRRLDGLFLPAAAASLLLLLGAGLYSAAYDAPITYPGIYDISTMRRIPYGEAYLVAFFVKVFLFLVLAVLAVQISRTLRGWNWNEPNANGAAAKALRRETLLNAGVGLAVVADVAVLIYLHYVSHLGVFLPEV